MEFLQKITPAIIFWLSFSMTPGPFWLTWMNYHTQPNTFGIYKKYIVYLITYFATSCFLVSYLVLTTVVWQKKILLPLYFIGAIVIFYIAIKSFNSQLKKKRIKLTYLSMVSISIFNPKFYLSVPVGSLSIINVTESSLFNSIIFSYVVMMPIILSGSLLYFFLGKLSLKSSYTKIIQGFTSILLMSYAVYLLIEGILLL